MAERDRDQSLTVAGADGEFVLSGPSAAEFDVVNDYLAYLRDRRYSPRTVRAYAFDLLHFCRWLSAEGTAIDAVSTVGMMA